MKLRKAKNETHAIKTVGLPSVSVILGTPEEMTTLSEQLAKLGINHVYMPNHKYYDTPFGIQEGYQTTKQEGEQ